MDTPISFSTILIISDSTVFCRVLQPILMPNAGTVLIARDLQEGRDCLARRPVDVVICEQFLPDGEGIELLDELNCLGHESPKVLLVTNDATEMNANRALEKGAAGYLAKPVSFHEIVGALKSRERWVLKRPPRRRPGGRVSLLGVNDQIDTPNGDSPQFLWYARDVSTTGAFLETEFALPVGSKLDLFIEIGCIRIRVKAVVVRVQQPSWEHGGGIGVEFFDYGDSARQALATYVSDGGADIY